jgi:creatinine amidohydrolase
MKTVKLEELNQDSFVEARIDKVILAFGSTESHGGHLPFGCDTFVSYEIALLTARRLTHTVVAPPLWFGMSEHYAHQPMCISLSDESLISVIREILESLIRWGVGKVLIINGHDGNIAAIDIATRRIKVDHPDFKVAVLSAWWVTAGNLVPADTFEAGDGLGHGGEGETSMGLAVFPHLCNMAAAKGMVPEVDDNVSLVWNFAELTDFGATGSPELASAEKGEKMKTALVDCLVDFVHKMDTLNWRYPTV